jgi:RNA ligase (TIGR02306 family)
MNRNENPVIIERITVLPHPNADALELAQVNDYLCVVGKGAYRTGDLVAYIPEQSVLPDELIEFLGCRNYLAGAAKNRVRAARLRGVLSQGICLPMAYFLVGPPPSEGDDVT